MRAAQRKGHHSMTIALPAILKGFFSPASDEHLLAGADETAVQALGVSQTVLATFPQDVATLCPDLVHEAQWGLSHRD
jgi:hypothetical protein